MTSIQKHLFFVLNSQIIAHKLILIVQTRRVHGAVPRSGAAADGRGAGEGYQAHHERLGQVGHS